MYYMYVLENEVGDLYFGATDDLRRRLREHNSAKSKSTKGSSMEANFLRGVSLRRRCSKSRKANQTSWSG